MTNDKGSTMKEGELFVLEASSFDRIYHNIDVDSEPKSIIFNAGTPVDRAESLEQLKNSVMNLGKTEQEKLTKKKKMRQGTFIGFLTKKQTEKEVTIPGQFATYYLVDDSFDSKKPPNDSILSLNLHICYLNTRLFYRHYPITKKTEPNSTQTCFQLAHFDTSTPSNEPFFTSIKSLLKHYTQFVYVDSITESGGLNLEVFPK